MASVLDLGLIDQFSSVFAILFIFLIVYAVLEVTKVLGQNSGVHGLIALIVALLSATSQQSLQVVTQFAPYMVIFIVFLAFLFMAAMFAGFAKTDVLSVLGGQTGAAVWIVIIAIITLFLVLSSVFGQSLLEGFGPGNGASTSNSGNITGGGDTGTGSFADNFGNTFFHPKILGFILIMLIGAFAIALLTGGGPKPG